MSTREDLIVNALSNRFAELIGERVPRIAPESFDSSAEFVARLREKLVNAEPAGLEKNSTAGAPSVWMDSDADCLSGLRALSLGDSLHLREGTQPPVGSFLQSLDSHRRDPDQNFQLLAERYACPLNFALPAEDEIREHILTRLMVISRASIEKQSVTAVNAGDLLLKLNLLAVHAQVNSDLRFLDALNYYYELLPADWAPRTRHSWLLPSYLGLYARALAVRILRKQTIAHSHTLEHPASSIADL